MIDRLIEHRRDARAARFRRSGDTMTITVPCDGALHTVRIDRDGHATLTDHDADTLTFLRALGNNEVFPCQQISGVADAARIWLDRRLRLDAPAGYYGASTAEPHRWRTRESMSCCREFEVSGFNTRRAPRRVLSGMDVEPGALLLHSRTAAHVATLTGVPHDHLDKVTRFLTAARGITADPRTMPESSQAQIRALLPAETTDHQISNLWALGVTVPFLTMMRDVLVQPDPAGLDEWDREHGPRNWAHSIYDLIIDWWTANVDPQWVRDLSAAVSPHWPAPVDYHDRGWLSQVLHWRTQEPAVIGAYVALGVRTGIPDLLSHGVAPQAAAEIQNLGTARYRQTAADWIRSGYTTQTALMMLRLDSTLVPLSPQEANLIDRERTGLSKAARGDLAADPQRLLAVGTLTRTPGRTVRWARTGLPVEQIAAALAAKVSPGEAEKRASRGQPVVAGA